MLTDVQSKMWPAYNASSSSTASSSSEHWQPNHIDVTLNVEETKLVLQQQQQLYTPHYSSVIAFSGNGSDFVVNGANNHNYDDSVHHRI